MEHDELQRMLAPFQQSLNELRSFRKCEDLSWDYRIRDLQGVDLFKFSLPEASVARELSWLIKAEALLHIQQKEFSKACESIQTGMRLAEFLGKGETAIQKLVGIAIQTQMYEAIIQASRTPGCPNLYWALASIPQPLIDIRPSILFELENIEHVFPVIGQAESLSLDRDGWRRMWQESINQFQELSGMSGASSANQLGAASIFIGFASTNAKSRLVEHGLSKESVDAMPSEKILALDSLYELRNISQQLSKQVLLPINVDKQWQAKQEQDCDELLRSNTFGGAIAKLILPAVRQIRIAETRVIMERNRLMTIEAIRMHVAKHKNVPATLRELREVPAMDDPFTQQPFEFSVTQSDRFYEVTLSSNAYDSISWKKDLRVRIAK